MTALLVVTVLLVTVLQEDDDVSPLKSTHAFLPSKLQIKSVPKVNGSHASASMFNRTPNVCRLLDELLTCEFYLTMTTDDF